MRIFRVKNNIIKKVESENGKNKGTRTRSPFISNILKIYYVL